ncbi:MAG TPA: YSIRK-type signal peptide-containing protein [Limosilactobacillus coleohominis]|nr:YSIRK-type signal peptide-containing protein [Limosilactobacillus coleohominis]
MVSKNNQIKYEKWNTNRKPHYGLRKLSIGVASVLLGTTLYWGGTTALADSNGSVTPLLRKLNRPQQIRWVVKIKNLVLI